MKYSLALEYAQEIKEILSPFCERIEIAGGIRRQKEEPHDIEIVCQPRSLPAIFTDYDNEVNMLDHTIKGMLRKSDINLVTNGDSDKAGKKAPCGPKYYRLKYRGEKLDIFSVIPPAQWGTVFLIRTGDADFSHEFVTRLWKFNLRSVDGHIERIWAHSELMKRHPEKYAPIVENTPEEIDAFNLCQLGFIEPKDRTKDIFLRLKELHA